MFGPFLSRHLPGYYFGPMYCNNLKLITLMNKSIRNIQLSGKFLWSSLLHLQEWKVLQKECHWNIWSCDSHQFLEVYLSINMRVMENIRYTPQEKSHAMCVWVSVLRPDWVNDESVTLVPALLSHDAHLTLSHHPKISWFPAHPWSQESTQNTITFWIKMCNTVHCLLYFKNSKQNRTCAVTWPPYVCNVFVFI